MAQEEEKTNPPAQNGNTGVSIGKIGQAMVPFTPVSFKGAHGFYAWGRLVAYGGLTLATYRKHKVLGYVFGSAAAISLLTSLGNDGWNVP